MIDLTFHRHLLPLTSTLAMEAYRRFIANNNLSFEQAIVFGMTEALQSFVTIELFGYAERDTFQADMSSAIIHSFVERN